MRLPKPYSTTEIQKKPWAVIVSLVIGLLMICTTLRIKQGMEYEARFQKMIDKTDSLNLARIGMYEQVLFYKAEAANANQKSDSALREKTSPYIQQLLPPKNFNRAN